MKNIKTHVLMVSEKFPANHKKKGKPTNFQDYILAKVKIHTIRSNYELWKKRIDEVNAGTAIISVRQWTGLPYRSKQKEFIQFNKNSSIGIQKLMDINDDPFSDITTITNQNPNYDGIIDYLEKNYTVNTLGGLKILATNDGLSVEDFKEWFKNPISEPMAIIHFTDFRY